MRAKKIVKAYNLQIKNIAEMNMRENQIRTTNLQKC